MCLGYLTDNTWNFCPEVLDEISTQGQFTAYVDAALETAAVPGTNLFQNDHVYIEATFTTTSQKSGHAFADGDDSLIAFVRPYGISMTVAMVAAPLQTSVNADNGDVTVSDALNYQIELCSSTPLSFPFTTITDDCFSNLGWNAADYLAFTPLTTASGSSNTIDANECAFSLRLDERVIPVDLPNSESTITITADFEVYYNGNENPTRRTLTVDSNQRRTLTATGGERQQTNRLTTSFGVSQQPMNFCTLNENIAYTGFKLTTQMDPISLPNANNVNSHVVNTRYALAEYLNVAWDQIDVVKIDRCVSAGCNELYPTVSGTSTNTEYNTVDYYIEVRNKNAATTFQEDLYKGNQELMNSAWMQGKIVKQMSTDHCNTELQNTFNSYRVAQNGDIYDNVEESSASILSVLALFIAALFY